MEVLGIIKANEIFRNHGIDVWLLVKIDLNPQVKVVESDKINPTRKVQNNLSGNTHDQLHFLSHRSDQYDRRIKNNKEVQTLHNNIVTKGIVRGDGSRPHIIEKL